MFRPSAVLLAVLIAAGCGGERPPRPVLSKEPVSVRGWILDIENPTGETMRFADPSVDAARKIALFRETAIYVEGAEYVSGGLAENGAFILLDVPPGNVSLIIQPPDGMPPAQLRLQRVPGNSDVLLPALVVRGPDVRISDLELVRVRMPYAGRTPPATELPTVITSAGEVPVVHTPLDELIDRRDFPQPGGRLPLATVR